MRAIAYRNDIGDFDSDINKKILCLGNRRVREVKLMNLLFSIIYKENKKSNDSLVKNTKNDTGYELYKNLEFAKDRSKIDSFNKQFDTNYNRFF